MDSIPQADGPTCTNKAPAEHSTSWVKKVSRGKEWTLKISCWQDKRGEKAFLIA